MSYAAFWIEIIVLSMFFTALTIAVSARTKGLKSWLVLAPNAFVFFALSAPAAGAAFLKYKLELGGSYFAYAMSLLAACVVGASLLSRLGARRPAGMPRASARWRIAPLAIGTLISLLVLAMTVWNMDLEALHQSEVVRARAGALLLSAVPPNMPDSQNAAVLYGKVFKAITTVPLWDSPGGVLGQDPPLEPSSPVVVQFLDQERGNLKLLRDAASLPVCRFDHDYTAPSIEMLLPEMSACRSAARLLKLDAAHELTLGHAREVMADINAIFALSRAAGGVPVMVSGMVAIGIDALATDALAAALPHVKKADDLEPLQIADWEMPSRMMRRNWRGEEAFGLSLFADIGSGQRTINGAYYTGKESTLRQRLEDLPYRVFLLDSDRRGYEQLLEAYYDMMDQPYSQTSARQDSSEFMKIRHAGIVTSMVAPAFNRLCSTVARGDASHSAALVGIAITRYRLDHTTLPDTLDALVPQYLAQLPVDPFDGHSLRYQKTGDDWRVYSIGPDNRDDGGTPYDPATHSGNISFVVKNR